MKLKLLLLTLLCFVGIELFAQEKSIKTDTHDMSLLDDIGYCPAKETYTYYEDADGNYIKHGNYSIVGKKNESVSAGFESSTHKVDYTLKATYKDGLLNGTVTATRVSVLSGTNHLTDKSAQGTEKQNFSGGYRNGLPHGVWTYTKVVNDKTVHSVSMNFTNGVVTGNYSAIKNGEKSTGKFTTDGFYDGTWNHVRTQSVYGKGVELSFISRGANGSVASKRELSTDEKDITTKYINGEVTLEQLSKMGYHGHIITNSLDGYDLCLSEKNYLYIHNLSGDLTRTYRNNVVDTKIVLGKRIDWKKIHIMTDELLDLICYLDGYEVDEEPALFAQFKAEYKEVYHKEFNPADFKNTVRDFPRDDEDREKRYYGFYAKTASYIACGERYPIGQYYLTEAQVKRYIALRDKYNAEQTRIEEEKEAAKKNRQIQYDQARAALKRSLNAIDERDFNGNKRIIYSYFNKMRQDSYKYGYEEMVDFNLIAQNMAKIAKVEDASKIARYINDYSQYDILINYDRPDSVAVRRAAMDTDERREIAAKLVKRNINVNIFRDIAQITRCGYSIAGNDYSNAKEDEVLASLKTGCDEEFLRLYMIIYNAYSRDSLENYAMMLAVNDTMKILHGKTIKSFADAKKVAKTIQTYDDAVKFFLYDAIPLCQIGEKSSSSQSPTTNTKTSTQPSASKPKVSISSLNKLKNSLK